MKILRAVISRWGELEITIDRHLTPADLTYTAYRRAEPVPHRIPRRRRRFRLITPLQQCAEYRWIKLRIALGRYDGDGARTFTIYYAEHESGYAHYFVSYDDDKHGCGGRTFRLPMSDGSTVDIVGPYTGNAKAINKLVPGAKLYTARRISASVPGQAIRYPADLTVTAARAILASIPASRRR